MSDKHGLKLAKHESLTLHSPGLRLNKKNLSMSPNRIEKKFSMLQVAKTNSLNYVT